MRADLVALAELVAAVEADAASDFTSYHPSLHVALSKARAALSRPKEAAPSEEKALALQSLHEIIDTLPKFSTRLAMRKAVAALAATQAPEETKPT